MMNSVIQSTAAAAEKLEKVFKLMVLCIHNDGLCIENDEFCVKIRSRLTEAGADATVVTALDEIMWLFNIRGNPADIVFNPVIMSYAVVTVDPPSATLWVRLDSSFLITTSFMMFTTSFVILNANFIVFTTDFIGFNEIHHV